ncbi:MAG: nucleotidyltransferase domain-containing protein [Burkholderiaceae bacterium]
MTPTQPAALSQEQLRQVNTRIRLTPREQLAMKRAFAEVLPSPAEVYLYGSRTDRNAAGGDIDLLIHLPGVAFEQELELSAALLGALEAALGERKIDLLFTPTLGADAKAFVRLVEPNAVRLFP